MANNALSNGRVLHQSEQRFRNERTSDRPKKVPDIPAVESRNWLLHRYYTRHEYKICKALIEEELAKSNGHNEYANYLKGLILRREGKIQDSLDSFQNSYSVNSTNVNNVKQIAKSLFLLGSHKRAVEAYTEAEKMSDASDWEIHHSLGECYIRLCETEDAERELKKAIELTKHDAPYLTLARLYVAKDRVDEAIEIYNAALSTSRESEEAAIEMGLLYLRIGDDQRAFQEFGTVLANSPETPKAILPLSYIMQTHREHEVALSKYRIAAQFMPESSYLWNNVGMCFYGKQKYVAYQRAVYFPISCAASSLSLILRIGGANVPRREWCSLPSIIRAQKNFRQIYKSSRSLGLRCQISPEALRASKKVSDDSSLLVGRAMGPAISCLKRAHYLNPMALMPACNLGRVLLTTGQPASAAIYLRAAVTAGPTNFMPHLLLGLALKRLDELEEAEEVLSKAHSLAPQEPLVLINYAVVLETTGHRIRAAEVLVALNDIATVIDVEPQIVQTARNLAGRLGGQRNKTSLEAQRTLVDDEV